MRKFVPMKNPFTHERIPALARELAGMRFDNPVAVEPAPSYKRRFMGPSPFAFREIGPLDMRGLETALRGRFRQERLALNITQTGGSSTEELIDLNVNAFSRFYDFADIFVIDSCAKTPDGSRPLQDAETLSEVVEKMTDIRRFYEGGKAILVRLSPLLEERGLAELLHVVRMSGVDAVIAGEDRFCPELLHRIRAYTSGRFPIIACGGINSYSRAREMLDAGAAFVEVQRMAAGIILKNLEKSEK